MKTKNILITASILLTVLFSGISLYSFDGEPVGKIGSVNKSSGEITVESPKAAEKIQMGTKLYVRSGDRVIIMTATFPMQTIAKCKLAKSDAGSISLVKKGLQVYLYVAGVEKKEEIKKETIETADTAITANKTGAVERNKIIGKHTTGSFEKFIGFSRDDTIDNVISKLGQPTKTDDNSKSYNFDTAYWDMKDSNGTPTHVLTVSYYQSTKKLMTIDIYSIYGDNPMGNTLRNFLVTKKIKDNRASILGARVSDILQMFGKPNNISSNNYEYQISVNGKKFQVKFICYTFHNELCSNIQVHWFR